MADLAETLISEEEGRESCAYQDSRGLWTIGIGALIDKRMTGAGLCDAAIDAQFANDSAQARTDAAKLQGYEACNDVQRAVLVSMCFQLGGLEHWPIFRAAVASGDYKAAAAAGLDSQWARQTPTRAQREMAMLESGTWIER